MNTHTPGPFRIIPAPHMGEHPNHEFRFIGTADFDEEMGNGQVLAKLTDSPEIRGNAALFAAAPDLLAICERIERGLPSNTCDGGWGGPGDPSYAADLRTAIAKAKWIQ